MSIFAKVRSFFKNDDFKSVRIEKVKPFELKYDKTTDTVWFENHNIEQCIRATQKLHLKHIHLQTDNIDFINDPRLANVIGIGLQYPVDNIEPLYKLTRLTHLGMPDNIKTQFDFSNFKDLIYLGGTLPKNYAHFKELTNLKYTRLFEYRKKDFEDFAFCSNLETLWIYSSSVENLNGLSNLSNLVQLDLENCRKLKSLEGIGHNNEMLENIHLVNCKNLKNADDLKYLPNLTQLQLYQILELNSFEFLKDLTKLEILMLHPSKVGVKNQDYYPLIDTLKKINKLDNIKGWKPLKSYLDGTFELPTSTDGSRSELDLLRSNLGIINWVEKSEDGLEQYSKKNCKKAESIILDMIKELERTSSDSLIAKEQLIKDCVLSLNKFNDSLDGSFIETGEREELCDLFDDIAVAVGLDPQNYPGGIADNWREW
jgi:hypothetical protein